MGLTSLESLDSFCHHNRSNYDLYNEQLQDVPGIALHQYDRSERHNYQYIVLDCKGDEPPLTRNELLAVLQPENVIARRYFYPGCHHMEPYRTCTPAPYFAWQTPSGSSTASCWRPTAPPSARTTSEPFPRCCGLPKTTSPKIRGAIRASARSGRTGGTRKDDAGDFNSF